MLKVTVIAILAALVIGALILMTKVMPEVATDDALRDTKPEIFV